MVQKKEYWLAQQVFTALTFYSRHYMTFSNISCTYPQSKPVLCLVNTSVWMCKYSETANDRNPRESFQFPPPPHLSSSRQLRHPVSRTHHFLHKHMLHCIDCSLFLFPSKDASPQPADWQLCVCMHHYLLHRACLLPEPVADLNHTLLEMTWVSVECTEMLQVGHASYQPTGMLANESSCQSPEPRTCWIKLPGLTSSFDLI